MTPREQGFLLLTCSLGDPERKVLTTAQLRGLSQRVSRQGRVDKLRDLAEQDLMDIGYDREFARRVMDLLSEEDRLEHYCRQARRHGCAPISRVSPEYPAAVHSRLGADSPGCLWYKGDLSLLEMPAVSVVGSRDLRDENREFARALGMTAAQKGIAVVSGNARGADKTVQQACLDASGCVISVVADSLCDHTEKDGVLYLSEQGFDLPFSSQRALSRNRVIHTMGSMVFVVQCTSGKGGTWSGSVQNLHRGWSPLYCYNDGSDAVRELLQFGAGLVDLSDLPTLENLQNPHMLFDI